ncbi:hypothetical protein [Caulobacter sp. RHG1]|uniref:hypothetical protein n=1 Tax=Caulobacter sp. (strain RHG1) TaxID=2545762 RepID=UPI001551DEEE|nr:hypothetical protein [Caulobacter sp. RHG1]NQE63983.1 putative membrane protein [Caulobacter sp. RHG1]
MNDLIDRYLAAVAALLPKGQRQDIIAELRDLIMNKVEEAEERLGRPLDKNETETLLREIGHPIAVAGRYGPRRALVGPELYPYWEFGVKVLLAIAAIAAVVPAVIMLLTGEGDARLVSRTVGDFVPTAMTLIGFATLVAAAFERGWIKTDGLTNWKVADLPQLSGGKTLFVKSRFEGVFELAVTLLFIGWWTKLVPFPAALITDDNHALSLVMSPIFQTLWWPVLALAIIQIPASLIAVVRPGWVRGRSAVEIVCSLGGLALVAVLWPMQPLVTVVAPDANVAGLANLQRSLDLSIQVGLVIAAGVYFSKLAVDVWRVVKG